MIGEVKVLPAQEVANDSEEKYQFKSNVLFPKYKKGDCAILRKVKNTSEVVEGNAYLIKTVHNSSYVRYLSKSHIKNYWKLSPADKSWHSEIEMHKSQVKELFMII